MTPALLRAEPPAHRVAGGRFSQNAPPSGGTAAAQSPLDHATLFCWCVQAALNHAPCCWGLITPLGTLLSTPHARTGALQASMQRNWWLCGKRNLSTQGAAAQRLAGRCCRRPKRLGGPQTNTPAALHQPSALPGSLAQVPSKCPAGRGRVQHVIAVLKQALWCCCAGTACCVSVGCSCAFALQHMPTAVRRTRVSHPPSHPPPSLRTLLNSRCRARTPQQLCTWPHVPSFTQNTPCHTCPSRHAAARWPPPKRVGPERA